MKAAVTGQHGPPREVLRLAGVATPRSADDEVLIRLYASSVNPLDSFTIRGPLFFVPKLGTLLKPKHKIAGVDFAGRVESVGRDIKQFRPGDEVFGASFTGKGLGGFAEFVCVRENSLAPKPTNLSFEESAAVPVAAITALQGLRDHGQIRRGQKVLIDGASGGVGTFAVQIAKSFGAEVTAVCSPSNWAGHGDRCRPRYRLHSRRFHAERVAIRSDSRRKRVPFNFRLRRALTRDGIFVMVGGSLARILQAVSLGPLLSRIGNKKVRFFIAKINGRDLLLLKDLLEAGKVVPVIDRRYPLSELAEALHYREEGHAQGKVVITIHHGDDRLEAHL